jgi:hypothetical protein
LLSRAALATPVFPEQSLSFLDLVGASISVCELFDIA